MKVRWVVSERNPLCPGSTTSTRVTPSRTHARNSCDQRPRRIIQMFEHMSDHQRLETPGRQVGKLEIMIITLRRKDLKPMPNKALHQHRIHLYAHRPRW